MAADVDLVNSAVDADWATVADAIDLRRVANELGENMTDEELQEMIDEADRDGDGEVSQEEFLRIMMKTNLF